MKTEFRVITQHDTMAKSEKSEILFNTPMHVNIDKGMEIDYEENTYKVIRIKYVFKYSEMSNTQKVNKQIAYLDKRFI